MATGQISLKFYTAQIGEKNHGKDKIRAEQCRGHCFSKVYIVILHHAEKSEERDFGFECSEAMETNDSRWTIHLHPVCVADVLRD